MDGLNELKEYFLSLGLVAPIDVIYMTTNEEIYLDFITKQNAVLITPESVEIKSQGTASIFKIEP